MKTFVVAVDQSTSATKALLFSENGSLLNVVGISHRQYYPREGWVEHDPEEIYANMLKAIRSVISECADKDCAFSLALTNQRETVVVWNRKSGKPVYNAVVWQCLRGKEICDTLKKEGWSDLVKERSGLIIDPYFAGSGARWILDNVAGAREAAERGELCMGTMDSWLIFKLTGGKVHATDYTNASRTMLFNIHTLEWDDDLLRMLNIPRSMMPEVFPCDTVFGLVENPGIFDCPVEIAGVLGDSHGALAGQMCFAEGLGKVTYGTGSSVMVNIGEKPSAPPHGLVTSVGFSALGKTFYAFEGNIHCTGATIAWLKDELKLIDSPADVEEIATSVEGNGGVYFIPAFAGLAAPWWRSDVRAQICGLTLGSGRAYVCRAALESIGYQVKDLVDSMTESAGIRLKELRVDGGPTKNNFLMQFQADLLDVSIVRSEVEDACAYGAFVMNGFAREKWQSFDQAAANWSREGCWLPCVANRDKVLASYAGWQDAVRQLVK